ncbi:hypothetical protein P5673_019227 [Acropora cervicornis]|uniref:Uncharacterized protein n=1 Tax=Acropora cervicornis TaxID=6130 RepID=A0AAD9QC49_ACRCE|nr:hypothetical protein P5673_019227 [Acropora cervicornis]
MDRVLSSKTSWKQIFLGKCSGVESDGATVVLTTLTFPVTLSCDQVPLPGEEPFERVVTETQKGMRDESLDKIRGSGVAMKQFGSISW